ncbi:MAG TPA: iron-sulfur cluster assembly scaffold protein [Elusimicrobia bacterium]|nr:iron-sulfur cluster assembly scaffold protein [Elusimicrobiota bacterium]
MTKETDKDERKMKLEEAVKKYSGRLNDPDSASSVTGPCGDRMEFYLNFDGDRIKEVRFHAEGCDVTSACGAIVAFHADGRTLDEAFFISPGLLLKTLGRVPEDHRHCAILACTAFFRAVADRLLEP